MVLIGMSMVNVMSLPVIVQANEPGMRPCMPEKQRWLSASSSG